MYCTLTHSRPWYESTLSHQAPEERLHPGNRKGCVLRVVCMLLMLGFHLLVGNTALVAANLLFEMLCVLPKVTVA